MSSPRGRFAPSPTGPLHMGSLITAVASFLDIRQLGGAWFVRIDDIDPPRAVAGASDAIIASLNAHGLRPDGPIQYQSEHAARHEAALAQLEDRTFVCDCTRAELAGTVVYPGRCRTRGDVTAGAIRLRVTDGIIIDSVDLVTGPQRFVSGIDFGDTIVRRKDGLLAYQLATAVDDGHDFDRILRGSDLSTTTPVQRFIMQCLNLDAPRYGHLPVLRFPDGTKLSKQAHAPPIDDQRAVANLVSALAYLGIRHPPEDAMQRPEALLQWALARWDLDALPGELEVFSPPPAEH